MDQNSTPDKRHPLGVKALEITAPPANDDDPDPSVMLTYLGQKLHDYKYAVSGLSVLQTGLWGTQHVLNKLKPAGLEHWKPGGKSLFGPVMFYMSQSNAVDHTVNIAAEALGYDDYGAHLTGGLQHLVSYDRQFDDDWDKARRNGNTAGQAALVASTAADWGFTGLAAHQSVAFARAITGRPDLFTKSVAGRFLSSPRWGVGGGAIMVGVPLAQAYSRVLNYDVDGTEASLDTLAMTGVGAIVGGGTAGGACLVTSGLAAAGTIEVGGEGGALVLTCPAVAVQGANTGAFAGSFLGPALKYLPGPLHKQIRDGAFAWVNAHKRNVATETLNQKIEALLPKLEQDPRMTKLLDTGDAKDAPPPDFGGDAGVSLQSGTGLASLVLGEHFMKPWLFADGNISLNEVIDKMKTVKADFTLPGDGTIHFAAAGNKPGAQSVYDDLVAAETMNMDNPGTLKMNIDNLKAAIDFVHKTAPGAFVKRT